MTALTPFELGRQLKRPEGEAGIAIGQLMNQSNKIMYEEALELLNFSAAAKVLEIGFGNGLFFPEFLKKQPALTLYGLDFSETMLAEANRNNTELVKQGKLKLTCANSAEMPFPDSEFDCLLTLNTLYFWPDPLAQLQEIHRVLKPGGRFLLGFRTKEVMEQMPFAAEVFRLYTNAETESLVKQAGFELTLTQENQTTVQAPDGKTHVLKGSSILARKPVKQRDF